MMTKEQEILNEGVEVKMIMYHDDLKSLKKIQKESEYESPTEVVRAALYLYEYFLKQQKDGAEIILKNGTITIKLTLR